MKKRLFFVSILFCATLNTLSAQVGSELGETRYRRSSLYSVLVSHDEAKYYEEIENAFLTIPIPDKFDNHDLSIKILSSKDTKSNEGEIVDFVNKNNFAHHMVAKWFERDPATGECDMSLITQRGLYDASYADIELAQMSQRGLGMLADAGEELINNTFLIVNDIRYIDKQKSSEIAGQVVGGLMSILGASFGVDLTDISDQVSSLISEIKGFRVNITTHLFKLEWNEELANEFYSNAYIQRGDSNIEKRDNFKKCPFVLTYVGNYSSNAGEATMGDIYDPNAIITRSCARAIDESIAKLQKRYEVFRIKVPLYSTEPLVAMIGLKEGVEPGCQYEVLEQKVNENGKTTYNRIGVIEPVEGMIWDNRYMATEEGSYSSQLKGTTFRVISGTGFYPGLLIREIVKK